jgi:hypothetical protein
MAHPNSFHFFASVNFSKNAKLIRIHLPLLTGGGRQSGNIIFMQAHDK